MSLRAFPTKRGQWWLAILAESEVFTGFGAARESCGSALETRDPRRKMLVFNRIGFRLVRMY